MGIVEVKEVKHNSYHGPDDGMRYEGGVQVFDLEELCPLELIRTHTKTDDVPFVTDEQLRLYRKAAFEAAQQYSAVLCGPVQQVVEAVRYRNPTVSFRKPHQHIVHDTQFPVHAPFVYTWRGILRENKPIKVAEGQRRIKVAMFTPDMYFDSCCADPCGNTGGIEGESSQQIMYYAGYNKVSEIPSGIVLGMLKYIAWSVMRPGDELLTQRNRTSIAEAGVTGTNNAAWASGALELWVTYDDLRY